MELNSQDPPNLDPGSKLVKEPTTPPPPPKKQEKEYNHDRNLSLPSNMTSPHRELAHPRPTRAATYSRALPPIRKHHQLSIDRPSGHPAIPNIPQGLSLRPVDTHTSHSFVFQEQQGQSQALTAPPTTTSSPVAQSLAISSPTNASQSTEVYDNFPLQTSSDPVLPQQQQSQALAPNKSKQHDPKTPSEYALHILFTQFVRYAERKLNLCLGYSYESEPNIGEILGEGKDPSFDKIIASLGYIARRKPKPVIDSVMFWRKSKSEATAQAANNAPGNGNHSRSGSYIHGTATTPLDPREAAIQADRKSLVSIYILCRVLMEIVRQTPPEVLGDDLSEKLEEIVFKQLRTAEPDLISGSIIRRANWNLFAKLLGEMSDSRFISVGDRFIAELEKIPATQLSKEKEVSTQLVIHGMRYLKMRLYPMDMLEESANFLESLAKFFSRTQNMTIKLAYMEVISQILLPIPGVATAELNHPTWVQATELLFSKSMELISRPKLWIQCFPFCATVLSVAPQELFANNWLQIFENNAPKLKERNNRATFYTGAARLLWVYMCRNTESLNNTTKKLDIITRTVLGSSNKKAWTVSDPYVNPPCVNLIRVAAYGYRQYVLENLIFQFLLNNANGSSEVHSLDALIPERSIIAIKAFVEILTDVESGERPPFPTDDLLTEMVKDPRIKDPAIAPKPFGALLEVYEKFSRALYQLLTLCDTQFGANRRATEERSQPSKAPIGVSFHFGSDSSSQNQRSLLVDLFCVIIESFPWTLANDGTYSKVIETLCRNTIHSNSKVSLAAIRSLKVLAQTRDTRVIVVTFSKLLFSYDEKLFTAYDPSASSSSDYERLLRVYVELLEIWVEKIGSSAKKESTTSTAATQLNRGDSPFNFNGNNLSPPEEEKRPGGDDAIMNSWWPSIEEVEGNGLYFLCSQDRVIRHLAIKILRLTAEFDKAIRQHEEHIERTSNHSRRPSKSSMAAPCRLINYLERADVAEIFESSNPPIALSMPERTRLQKLSSKKKESLIKVAESDYGVDTALWLKAFPSFVKVCFLDYPIPIAIARNVVCVRLVKMHDVVLEYMRADSSGYGSHGFLAKHSMRTHPEVVVEQWRIYLIVACLTLTLTDEQKLHVPDSHSHHSRKKSVQKVTIHHQRITSVRSVFRMVIPLLGVDNPVIRDAIVTGIACINVNIYRALLECMQPAIEGWKSESKKAVASSQAYGRQYSAPRRDSSTGYRQDRVITEIAHAFKVTSYYLSDPMIFDDEWVITVLIGFLDDLTTFLFTSTVQTSWDYQKLRRYYCGIVENLLMGVNQSKKNIGLLTFETRVKYFRLIEEWCEFRQHNTLARDREAIMKQAALNTTKDSREKNMVLASMELEKRKSEMAIMNAMAALCAGPIQKVVTDCANGIQNTSSFNVEGILGWINNLLTNSRDDLQVVGRKALRNLLEYNPEHKSIFGEAVANCYKMFPDPKTARSYFKTVAEVLLSNPEYPCEVRQALTLGLFKTGDEDFEIRSLAGKLLYATETRFYVKSCMHEFETSVVSRSPTIYKRVLFSLSTRFANDHPQDAFMIFSEMSMFFHRVSDMSRRDILSVLLPWVQIVELQMDGNDQQQPNASAMMVLCNLLEITVAFSDRINNEVEALWVALANGLYPNNLNVILDFVVRQSLAKRDPTFVQYARKIVLYLASSIPGHALLDTLVGYLVPKSMIPVHPEELDAEEAKKMYPYVAEMDDFLPIRGKEISLSQCQLAIILLVDLMITPNDTVQTNLPLILHVAIALFDHYIPIVSDQAREMLVLIVNGYTPLEAGRERFLEKLRQGDTKLQWAYDDLNSDKDGARTPPSMNILITQVLDYLTASMPDIRKLWARIALHWATACPVRHIACRSFQIFRCLLSYMDQGMLADMLARLSNTISDSTPDIQGFAMQILMTLNAVAAETPSEELINYPQLFWAAVACLNTVHEEEFIEVLSILEKFLSKIDLNSPDTVSCLVSVFPNKWEGEFQGLQQALLPGLRSSNSWEQTLVVLEKLNKLEPNEIVGSSHKLALAICTNMPRYLHALEMGEITPEVVASAEVLRECCDKNGQPGLSRILSSLANNRFRTKKDFLIQTVQAIQTNFFPDAEVVVLSFFLGILSNRIRWVREETMEILKLIFPMVDMKREEFSGVGADLISPLLRLLRTDFAEQALSVLDEASSISASKMDKHVLRMSLGNRTLRKEYERTATLFGIPDESGWSVPQPAITASITRNNVHAVFYTCASSSVYSNQDANADEFQFHKEEAYGYGMDRTDGTPFADDGSMNQMWTALDNLDSFFASNMKKKPSSNRAYHAHSVSVTDTDASVDNAIDPVESAPQLYDKKVSIILNRSLARTPSTTSFKTSLADSFGGGGEYYHNSSNYTQYSSDSFGASRLAYPQIRNLSSKRRQIVEFGREELGGFGDDEANGDADDEEFVRDDSYNSFDTIRYPDHSNKSSPSLKSPVATPPHPPAVQYTANDRKTPVSNESSFRLESLLKGASTIGKKKKSGDKSKKEGKSKKEDKTKKEDKHKHEEKSKKEDKKDKKKDKKSRDQLRKRDDLEECRSESSSTSAASATAISYNNNGGTYLAGVGSSTASSSPRMPSSSQGSGFQQHKQSYNSSDPEKNPYHPSHSTFQFP
ncbi:cell morphogenesis protein PAG1 [Trichomonascus vanleenenianus]|uniref:Tao3p n=1 Tax=Trichomonascus vanleenenianus TaxID=2268995 RepID=UPI003ECA5AA3